MKKIKFSRSILFDETECLEQVKTEGLDELEIISTNISEVMICAGDIETKFDFYILGFFMPDKNDKQKIFKEQILHTSSFNFNLKRSVVISLIKEYQFLTGSELSEFEKISSKVIKYRNALAHGSIMLKDGEFQLDYYEGQKRVKKLNDEYWSALQDTYKDMQRTLKKLSPMFEEFWSKSA